MSVNSFHELLAHVGHEIVVVSYGQQVPVNVAVECETCDTVLLDFDRDDALSPVEELERAAGVIAHPAGSAAHDGPSGPGSGASDG